MAALSAPARGALLRAVGFAILLHVQGVDMWGMQGCVFVLGRGVEGGGPHLRSDPSWPCVACFQICNCRWPATTTPSPSPLPLPPPPLSPPLPHPSPVHHVVLWCILLRGRCCECCGRGWNNLDDRWYVGGWWRGLLTHERVMRVR